jgi:5-methyltetrahydropteroyltriglutamate--homocysteine methyltransferase
MARARIQTTVVGSHPIPAWLAACPSEQALVDATRVVLHTQERAGVDLVCDGKLYRFNVNHPETNGMIDYFVRPLAGMRSVLGFRELQDWREQPGMGFRAKPPGVCDGPIGPGALDLASVPAATDRGSTGLGAQRSSGIGWAGGGTGTPERRAPGDGDPIGRCQGE